MKRKLTTQELEAAEAFMGDAHARQLANKKKFEAALPHLKLIVAAKLGFDGQEVLKGLGPWDVKKLCRMEWEERLDRETVADFRRQLANGI